MWSFSECSGGVEFVMEVFEVCVGIEVLGCLAELCWGSEDCEGCDCGGGVCDGLGGCGCAAGFEFL